MVKACFLAVVLVLAAGLPARAEADVTGLWSASFMGNNVNCQVEQRGQFIYGVARVTTRTGEVNVYHLAGVVVNGKITAIHGSGNFFEGQVAGPDQAEGTFHFRDGMTMGLTATRTQPGLASPALDWPAGLGPSGWKPGEGSP
jgi:hypothetical protein